MLADGAEALEKDMIKLTSLKLLRQFLEKGGFHVMEVGEAFRII